MSIDRRTHRSFLRIFYMDVKAFLRRYLHIGWVS